MIVDIPIVTRTYTRLGIVYAECLTFPGILCCNRDRHTCFTQYNELLKESVPTFIYRTKMKAQDWPIDADMHDEAAGIFTTYREINIPRETVPRHLYKYAECIVCSKLLIDSSLNTPSSTIDKENPYSIHGGVICYTHGNWGSTAFDLDGAVIEFYLCDNCLRQKRDIMYKYANKKSRENLNSLFGGES